jgi:hypothetical protein
VLKHVTRYWLELQAMGVREITDLCDVLPEEIVWIEIMDSRRFQYFASKLKRRVVPAAGGRVWGLPTSEVVLQEFGLDGYDPCCTQPCPASKALDPSATSNPACGKELRMWCVGVSSFSVALQQLGATTMDNLQDLRWKDLEDLEMRILQRRRIEALVDVHEVNSRESTADTMGALHNPSPTCALKW